MAKCRLLFLSIFINYLVTETEDFTVKSQTKRWRGQYGKAEV